MDEGYEGLSFSISITSEELSMHRTKDPWQDCGILREGLPPSHRQALGWQSHYTRTVPLCGEGGWLAFAAADLGTHDWHILSDICPQQSSRISRPPRTEHSDSSVTCGCESRTIMMGVHRGSHRLLFLILAEWLVMDIAHFVYCRTSILFRQSKLMGWYYTG